MAILGYTKLEAVNQMLRAVNLPPVSALDPGGDSEEGEAEAVLDLVSRQVQGEGWPENTEQFKTYAAGGAVTVGSDVLRVRGSGPDAHRNLVLNGDDLYDADKGSATITATRGSTVFLEVVRNLSFEDCSPTLKDKIVADAMLTFQQRKQGESREATLTREAVLADIRAQRLRPNIPSQPPNTQPVLPSVVGATTGNERG